MTKVLDKQKALESVAANILADDVCPHLRTTATQLVPGEGSPDAWLMFVGEAPGKNEDLQGKPFVGASGKLLTAMLAGIGIARDEVFITSILKYRPPNNRDPKPQEVRAFLPYLVQQIEIIQPKLIVLLGRHAMNAFLPDLRISDVHGQLINKNDKAYLPLYHPAAALYNGGLRQTLTEDFNKIPKILEFMKTN